MSEPARPQFPRVARARTGYFLGVLLLAAGIGWALAIGWGLAVAGAGLIVWSVVLYDVDEPGVADGEREVFR